MSFNIIDTAKRQLPANDFKINTGTVVEREGKRWGLLGDRVIVFCPPTQHQGQQGDLHETYRQIFRLFEKGAQTDETLLLPCFSTKQGGLSKTEAAQTAVQEAKAYLETHPQHNIKFVTYPDAVGRENAAAYKTAIQKAIAENGSLGKRLSQAEGDITQFQGTSVMPVQPRYNLEHSGPTAKAIDKAARRGGTFAGEMPSPTPREASTWQRLKNLFSSDKTPKPPKAGDDIGDKDL